MSKYREFSSYNGFDRTVLFMGIPLPVAMGIMLLAVIIMFVGMYFFSIIGFLFVIVVVPIIFFVRSLTQHDDKALTVIGLETKFRAKRIFYKEFGNTLTIVNGRYYQHKKVAEKNFYHWREAKKSRLEK